jgi:hypothetical protein
MSNDLHERTMGGSCGKASIARQERCRQRLGECQVDRVICRRVLAELPDAVEQWLVWMDHERKVQEILESLSTPASRQLASAPETPKDLSHFDGQELGSVERLSGGEDPRLDRAGERSPEQELQRCGRVENDQALSTIALEPDRARRGESRANRSAAAEALAKLLGARAFEKAIELDAKVIGQREAGSGCAGLQAPVNIVGHVTDLNHPRHVVSLLACVAHVEPHQLPVGGAGWNYVPAPRSSRQDL